MAGFPTVLHPGWGGICRKCGLGFLASSFRCWDTQASQLISDEFIFCAGHSLDVGSYAKMSPPEILASESWESGRYTWSWNRSRNWQMPLKNVQTLWDFGSYIASRGHRSPARKEGAGLHNPPRSSASDMFWQHTFGAAQRSNFILVNSSSAWPLTGRLIYHENSPNFLGKHLTAWAGQ